MFIRVTLQLYYFVYYVEAMLRMELLGMKIVDTTPTFFHLLETEKAFGLESLNRYHSKHPEVFDFYFQYHYPHTDERLTTALNRYKSQLDEMLKVVSQLPSVIIETWEQVANYLDIELCLQFYLLVGAFGSNAYVNQKVKADVFLAIEKLSSNHNHLRVIVAHELGHVSHNILLDQAGIDWASLAWEEGTTSLYREGIATYISQQAVPAQAEDVYFLYDDSGEEWLAFCKENHAEIAASFLKDAKEWTYEKEREWFRLSGGKQFGYNRLGYYIGTEFIRHSIGKIGEKETFTLWAYQDIKIIVLSWLEKEANLGI